MNDDILNFVLGEDGYIKPEFHGMSEERVFEEYTVAKMCTVEAVTEVMLKTMEDFPNADIGAALRYIEDPSPGSDYEKMVREGAKMAFRLGGRVQFLRPEHYPTIH